MTELRTTEPLVSWRTVAVTKMERLRGLAEGDDGRVKEVVQTIKPRFYTISPTGKIEVKDLSYQQNINILA